MITFDEILKRLSPFATRGWIKRFNEVRNGGPKKWILVVRDLDVQTPEVEYAVNDVVRELDILQPRKSLVRLEMEKLESEGKLKLDTPEEEAYWEKRLEDERKQHQEWKQDENNTYIRQKKLDLEFLRKKREAEENPTPTAHIGQDPHKNPAINPEPPKPPMPSIPDSEVTNDEKPDEQPAPVAPVIPTEEKKEFIPKPPPEKEAPILGPKLKSVAVDGAEVYTAGKETVKVKVEDIEGMPEEAATRLKGLGISTEDAFKKMDKGQAKMILGTPLFMRYEKDKMFTS